jgi:nucleoporin POM34
MSTISTALVSNSSQALSHATPSRIVQNTPTPGTTPSTPLAKVAEPTPSPGTFRHPRLTEIISRQHRTTFDERNIRSATINAGVLVLSFIFSHDIHSTITSLFSFLHLITNSTSATITFITISLLRLLFIVNTVFSLRPILPYFSDNDNINDIPLTPSQRSLLGLPPSTSKTPIPLSTTSSPTFGTSGYVTPPRYQRQFSSGSSSSTPSTNKQDISTDRRSISANYSTSPLSTSRYTLGFSPSPSAPQTQPYARRTASGSPFSPTASPLFKKAIRQKHQYSTSQDLEFSVSARSSIGPLDRSYNGADSKFGRSSLSTGLGLARSQSVKERGTKGQDGQKQENRRAAESPIAQKGVNYKWLYDKGFSGPGPGMGSASASARGQGMAKSESMQF